MTELTRPDYVHLVDLSGWQRDVDYEALGEQGFVGGWVKATEGQDHRASRCVQHARGLTDALLLQGPYHFATPGRGQYAAPGHIDAELEARFFCHVMADLPRPTLRPVLDLESGKKAHTRESLTDWVLTWLGEVEALSGLAPMLYAGTYLRRLQLERLAHVPLWVPHYPVLKIAPFQLHRAVRDRRLDAGKGPRKMAPGTWACWQWTSSGTLPELKGKLDLNIAPALAPLLAVSGQPGTQTSDAGSQISPAAQSLSTTHPAGSTHR